MKYLTPLRNWRIVALTILAMVAFALIIGETDDLTTFVTIKAAGFALAYACYRLSCHFDRRHLIDELNVFSEDL